MAGALDGASQLALVPGACPGLAARPDLAVFCDIATQQFSLFVIDENVFLGAELADARVREEALSAALCIGNIGLVAHDNNSLEGEFVLFPSFKLRTDLGGLAALAEHDHLIGNYLGGGMLVAFGVVPMTGLQAAST